MDIKKIIVYEDKNIIVLNKPSGLLAIPGRFDRTQKNLYDILKGIYQNIFIVHRLDRDTSGIIIFAKNKEIHRQLSMLWEKHKVEKMYYALVHGRVSSKQGVIDKPIAPLQKKKGVMAVDYKKGKKSKTKYRVIKAGKEYTLLEVMPQTGRTHQIRVHFASIGHPVAGDVLYNRKEATGLDSFKDKFLRLYLHAYSVKFFYAPQGNEIKITATLPQEFLNIP